MNIHNQQSSLNHHNPNLIGFEEIFKTLNKSKTKINTQLKQDFPPHNLIKTSDNSYTLTLAIVGRNKEDINMELKDNMLTISADALETGESLEVIEHGIAFRSFKKKFKLQDSVIVSNAKLINGLLNIYLEHELPKDEFSTTIKID